MTMTTAEHRNLMALRDRFKDLLVTTAELRRSNNAILTGPDGFPELAWQAHERTVLLNEVNRVRVDRGLDQLSVATMQRADRLAAGHIDYADKLSFYCAEMVVNLPRWTEG